MRSTAVLLLSALLVAATPASADAAADAQLGRQIETAGLAGDVQTLAHLQQQLQAASKQADAGKYTYYYLGYADYTLADVYAASDVSKATDCLHEAEDALGKAVKLDAGFAEASALLGGSYDYEIGLHPFKGMWLGSKAAALLAQAAKQSPDDPRILMLQAISDYSTPSTFGGDKQRAMREYTSALARFQDFKPADAEAPIWGHAEAYAWRGDAEAGTQDDQAATKDYQAALELAPDYKYAAAKLSALQKPASK